MDIVVKYEGRAIKGYADINDIVRAMNKLNGRKSVFVFVHGQGYNNDVLLQVQSYRDLDLLIFECKRLYVSARGVDYVSVFP